MWTPTYRVESGQIKCASSFRKAGLLQQAMGPSCDGERRPAVGFDHIQLKGSQHLLQPLNHSSPKSTGITKQTGQTPPALLLTSSTSPPGARTCEAPRHKQIRGQRVMRCGDVCHCSNGHGSEALERRGGKPHLGNRKVGLLEPSL